MESIIVAHVNSNEVELALKQYLKKAKIKFTSNKSQPFNSEFKKKD